jgi:membrane protease subunit HflK
LINEAEAYSNDVVPRARGAAARKIQEAEGYKEQVIAQAQGETSRFSKLLAEYIKAPEVTRKRLYIESMESVMAGTNSIMIDVKSGNNLLYLPLDKMMQHQPSSTPPPMNLQSGSTDQHQTQPVVVPEQTVERTSTRSRDARGR